MELLFPRAFIFDWDNTLVDSWPAIAEAINHTRTHFGLAAWSLSEIKANCTRAARDSFPEWFGADWKKAYDLYYQGFDRVRKNRGIEVKPGAQELLQWLKGQKIPSFIVSNKRGDYLRQEVEKLAWGELFAAVVGAQDAPRDKPCREHVDYALQYAGITADSSIWFVGDSETDMQCAKNSGCTPVFLGEKHEAARLSVALVFSDCQALQTLLYNRFNNKVAEGAAGL